VNKASNRMWDRFSSRSVGDKLKGLSHKVLLWGSLSAVTIVAPAAAEAQADREDAAGAGIKACGLRIVAPPYQGEDELRAFNQFAGTSLALLLHRPAGGLIAFDEDASKLAVFADDKGQSLLTKGTFMSPGFSTWPKFSQDGKAALIEINGGAVPGDGAREVKAKGTMVFTAASEKKTFTQTGVQLKAGVMIEAGPIPFKITKTGKPDWGDEPLQITLEAKQDTDRVASVRFLDGGGNEIESSGAGSSSMRFGDSVTIETSYNLGKRVDAVTVEITYWMDMKAIEVPFDVTVTVSLSK
jgi:hypothetical protein